MKPNEALYWCEQFTDNIVLVDPQKEKMVLALQAMKQCKNALEKQIPKKPIVNFPFDVCPVCDRTVSSHMEYCSGCGQKIDWSDT